MISNLLEVLKKDAAAAAIYGSQMQANGVVIHLWQKEVEREVKCKSNLYKKG